MKNINLKANIQVHVNTFTHVVCSLSENKMVNVKLLWRSHSSDSCLQLKIVNIFRVPVDEGHHGSRVGEQ